MKRIIIILLLISLPVFAQLPTNPYGFNDIPLYENCFSPADGDSLFIRNVTKRIGWISTTYTAPDVIPGQATQNFNITYTAAP